MSQQGAPGQAMSREQIVTYLDSLARMLWDFRQEKRTDEWWTSIADRLTKDKYTFERAALSENWILKGNRYGRRETVLADFYPSKEQVESADIDIVPRAALERAVRETEDRVRLEVTSQLMNSEDRLSREGRKDMVEQARMKFDLTVAKNEVADLRRVIEAKDNHIAYQSSKIERLRALNKEYHNLLQQRGMINETKQDDSGNEAATPAGDQGQEDQVDGSGG